MSILRPI